MQPYLDVQWWQEVSKINMDIRESERERWEEGRDWEKIRKQRGGKWERDGGRENEHGG